MAVKTMVTCDRCGWEWEAKGLVGSYRLPSVYRLPTGRLRTYSLVSLCENCSRLYRWFLMKTDRDQDTTLAAFIEGRLVIKGGEGLL